MSENVQFRYMYRDFGNYKNWGEIVFSNHSRLNISEISNKLRNSLILGDYFVATSIRVPELFFPKHNSDDHSWHEFVAIEATPKECTDDFERDIVDLLQELLEMENPPKLQSL